MLVKSYKDLIDELVNNLGINETEAKEALEELEKTGWLIVDREKNEYIPAMYKGQTKEDWLKKNQV